MSEDDRALVALTVAASKTAAGRALFGRVCAELARRGQDGDARRLGYWVLMLQQAGYLLRRGAAALGVADVDAAAVALLAAVAPIPEDDLVIDALAAAVLAELERSLE